MTANCTRPIFPLPLYVQRLSVPFSAFRTEESLHIDESKLKKMSPTRANETIIQTAIVNSKIPRESSNLVLKTPPTSPRNNHRTIPPLASPTDSRPEPSDIPVSFIGGEEEPLDERPTEKKRIEEETRCNVTLTKDPYSGVGISVSGGKDTSNENITVGQLLLKNPSWIILVYNLCIHCSS